jgi:hypothetical protein
MMRQDDLLDFFIAFVVVALLIVAIFVLYNAFTT